MAWVRPKKRPQQRAVEDTESLKTMLQYLSGREGSRPAKRKTSNHAKVQYLLTNQPHYDDDEYDYQGGINVGLRPQAPRQARQARQQDQTRYILGSPIQLNDGQTKLYSAAQLAATRAAAQHSNRPSSSTPKALHQSSHSSSYDTRHTNHARIPDTTRSYLRENNRNRPFADRYMRDSASPPQSRPRSQYSQSSAGWSSAIRPLRDL